MSRNSIWDYLGPAALAGIGGLGYGAFKYGLPAYLAYRGVQAVPGMANQAYNAVSGLNQNIQNQGGLLPAMGGAVANNAMPLLSNASSWLGLPQVGSSISNLAGRGYNAATNSLSNAAYGGLSYLNNRFNPFAKSMPAIGNPPMNTQMPNPQPFSANQPNNAVPGMANQAYNAVSGLNQNIQNQGGLLPAMGGAVANNAMPLLSNASSWLGLPQVGSSISNLAGRGYNAATNSLSNAAYGGLSYLNNRFNPFAKSMPAIGNPPMNTQMPNPQPFSANQPNNMDPRMFALMAQMALMPNNQSPYSSVEGIE